MTNLICSSEECSEPATEALTLRGQPGHIHDCPSHAATVREWCDVTKSASLVDGCPWSCTGNTAIWTGQPQPLGGTPDDAWDWWTR